MIAIINAYGGNISSIVFGFERLQKKCVLTTDPDVIRSASHVILPGVATAKQSMNALQKFKLVELIRELKQPVLGICLGMQILYESSEEGEVDCLSLVPGKIVHLSKIQKSVALPFPQMGWNQLEINTENSPLLKGVENYSYFYYVHSFAAPITTHTIASTEYGSRFTGIVQNRNFFGTQFHPERSGKIGERILQNFIEID